MTLLVVPRSMPTVLETQGGRVGTGRERMEGEAQERREKKQGPAGWLDRLRLREDVGRILICGLGPVRGRGSGATKLARGRCRSGSCSEREKAAPLNSSLGVLASRLRCELCGGGRTGLYGVDSRRLGGGAGATRRLGPHETRP